MRVLPAESVRALRLGQHSACLEAERLAKSLQFYAAYPDDPIYRGFWSMFIDQVELAWALGEVLDELA